MVQQWFLDLDGVRSGPYQTPEVLGLIAEGEVLPHHRISSSLKDEPWTTVLEWRLEQAQLDSTAAHKKSYIPEGQATGAKPQNKPYEMSWNEPEQKASASRPAPNKEVGAVDLNPEAEPDEIEEVIQVLNSPTVSPAEPGPSAAETPPAPQTPPAASPIHLVLEPRSKTETPAAHPAAPPAHAPHPPHHAHEPHQHVPHVHHASPTTPAAHGHSDAPAAPTRKRDPMAEMYDMLQNTKQKREAKEKAAHTPTPSHERDHKSHSPKPKAGMPAWKTAVIAVLITVAGFLLGQLFQNSEDKRAPSNPITSVEKNITAPAKPDAAVPAHTEVIDRSTDKMTIRARVERPANEPAIPRQQPRAAVPANPALNDKEMQELKDLKKELQELKALKDELKNAPAAAIDDGSEIPMDENYLTAPAYDENGGAAYSPNDAVVDPGAGGFPTPSHVMDPGRPTNY